MTKKVIREIKNPIIEREKGLKGILWDLLRLQFKITVIAFALSIVIIFIIYSVAPDYINHLIGNEPQMESTITSLGSYVSLLLLFSTVYLGTAWFFTYNYAISLKRSITYIIHQLKQFQRGSMGQGIKVERDDEIKKLAEQFNDLTIDVEKQIVSMRRILDENVQLIAEAEKAASLEERRKLARDLHDAVSQELFAVSMSLGAMPKLLEQKPEKAKGVFQQTEKMVHHAQQELRALIMHLRPVTLEGKGLEQAITMLFDELKRKHPHLDIHCNLSELPDLAPGMEEQLFRVIQEGISNALRHGNPNRLQFHSHFNGERVLLILEDDGTGFDVEAVSNKQNVSYGLNSMKERMVEIGGHFTVLSYPNKGTKLEFRIPIVRSNQKEEMNFDD
ncbi:sensor histidine kinase [Evansella sp. AB-P1]|uniref:sensor histidine kinase n=1 Tax=Evansella sp. AB-P1 TaxID=3037653 RepID=UPI00241E00B2|nr:sensor histidine kinase [Evansella sp. AB-P1]MDG5789149.1 sensor histidine kinase [Evansella sp. AB-P1]